MDRILLCLSEKERETLQLLNAALRVSEYTDDVDDIRRSRREDTMLPSMKEFFSAVAGLTLAASELPYATRKELENQKAAFGLVTPVLANAFEVARRHKRLNPNHNRGEYGKLVMILQDANAPGRLRSLGIEESLVKPITSVGAALEKIGASDMLKDELLKAAVRPILPGDSASVGAAKQAAHKELVDKYGGVASTTASPTTEQQPSSPKEKNGLNRRELVERCILSIADAKVFLHADDDIESSTSTTDDTIVAVDDEENNDDVQIVPPPPSRQVHSNKSTRIILQGGIVPTSEQRVQQQQRVAAGPSEMDGSGTAVSYKRPRYDDITLGDLISSIPEQHGPREHHHAAAPSIPQHTAAAAPLRPYPAVTVQPSSHATRLAPSTSGVTVITRATTTAGTKRSHQYPCRSIYHERFSTDDKHGSRECPYCTVCHMMEFLFNGCKTNCVWQHEPTERKVRLHLGKYADICSLALRRMGDWSRGIHPEKMQLPS
jgi:hypothetical protein